MKTRIIALALGVAAFAVPAAVASPGHGKAHERGAAKQHAKDGSKTKKAHKVTFVFKGTFTAPGTVEVASGNAHVRKGGFVGQSVTFDLATAKVAGVDTNADLKVDVTDVADGAKVLVQARVAKGTKFTSPTEDAPAVAIVARKLVDRSAAADDAAPAPVVTTP